MTGPTSTLPPREPQIAVVPLNTLTVEDVGLSAGRFDAWLQSISGGLVTLERLKNAAAGLPITGNIIALVDALNDIVTLMESDPPDPLDWVSLGINLIGMMPLPPGMTAARMSLRPALFLLRQEVRNNPTAAFGDALVGLLAGHLNSTLAGTLDDFVSQARGKLPGLLDDASTFGERLLEEIAGSLERVVTATLDAQGDLHLAGQQMHRASQQLLHDPLASIDNALNAAYSVYKAAGKGVSNTAAQHLLPEQARSHALRQVGLLRAMGPQLRQQLSTQTDPGSPHTLAWLLQRLEQAVSLWRHRRRHGQSINIKPHGVTQVRHQLPNGLLETTRQQAPVTANPNPRKNGACSGTCNSISFALGTETLSHTDFSLPGTYPINWTRTYCSRLAAYDQGLFGARWISAFTTSFDCVDDGLLYHDADGRSHAYPLPKVGKAHVDGVENRVLMHARKGLLVLIYGHERKEVYEQHGQHYRLNNVLLRSGAGLLLRYEHRYGEAARLSDLYTYQDDLSQLHRHLGTELDDQGRLRSLWEYRDGVAQRRLCTYHYDDAGDLVHAEDEHAAAWTYQYQQHLLNRYTDRTGRGLNLQWQGEGAEARAVREWADDGSFDTRLTWDPHLRLTYVTDAHGQETWHYLDRQGYTYRIRHPDGRSEWLFRDAAKNVIRHVHAGGSNHRYGYDRHGNLLEHILPDHHVVYYAYDELNQLTKVCDAEGGQWLRDYDTRGNLIETTDPLENKTEYAYNLAGLPTRVTDANGNEKTFAYNAAGQLTRYTDCSGKVSHWAYDERGQMTRFSDAAGQHTDYQYQAGQLVLIRHPDNSEERFARDAEGRLLTHVDGLDRCTTWQYNGAGLIAERVDGNEQRLRYHWDRLGRLTGLENENGRRATFHYDPVGRLLSETGFDGQALGYQYAADTGRLARIVNGEHLTDLEFDPMGRLLERRARLGTQEQRETYAYDGNGQLIMASNAHSRVQWFRDLAGNLTREHQHYLDLKTPTVAVWKHEYDALNQRCATVRPDGHRVSWLTYGSGHLLALRLDAHELLHYRRDDLHREIERQQGNELLHAQQWDPMGRLQAQTLQRGQQTLLKRDYHYDRAGQLTHLDDSRRGPQRYHYDRVGQLLSATTRHGRETFAFDPAGNRLDDTHGQPQPPLEGNPRSTQLLDNLLREYAGRHHRYDARGNLVERWQTGDYSRLRWDLFDRLVQFEDQRLRVDYTYDALGRRLSKRSVAHFTPSPLAGSGWNENERIKRQQHFDCGYTLYGWDGDTLAWEHRPVRHAGETGRIIHYLYEPGSFVPVVQAIRLGNMSLHKQPVYSDHYRLDEDPLWATQPEAQSFTELLWYQCDHLGTPQELTNQQGEIVWRAQHKAWGETQVQRSDWAQHKGIQNPLRFQGQYHDHETGLHYNRYRYYDPLVGRFISKDPIGYAGGLNLYVYAPNPVSWIDPLGLAAHRGRFQAQGEKLEESVAWNQDSPLTAIEARAKLEELKNKLDKGSLSVREEAFQKADNFVLSACKCGGVDAPVSKTFMVKGARRERVDIEVISGKAFGE